MMPEPEVVGWDLGGAAAADELERALAAAEETLGSSSNSCNQATEEEEEEEEWGMGDGNGMGDFGCGCCCWTELIDEMEMSGRAERERQQRQPATEARRTTPGGGCLREEISRKWGRG